MSYTYKDYTIGWISALAIELKAAEALLDEKHDDLPSVDENTYTLGCVSGHNVVIACLPHGVIGTNAAAHAAANLFRSFPNVRFAMLVGVGGGVPTAGVRLGDVVVGTSNGESGGIIQYDRGTNVQGKEQLVRKGFLRDPPLVVRNAITKMRALEDDGMIVPKCERPAVDELYEASYEHQIGMDCSACDKTRTIQRTPRKAKVHYGSIGSGNQVVRNAKFRDSLYEKDGIICFEMEAAGLLGAIECIVIRGICDYCDTHKNKHWQYYASVAAATYAKNLMKYIPRTVVANEEIERRRAEVLRLLHTCPYKERKDINAERIEGTCSWLTEHPLFLEWTRSHSNLLWVSAGPGCGKSVLARYLVDTYLPAMDITSCYFFFKEDFNDQKTGNDAMCALLRQLYLKNPSLLSKRVLDKYQLEDVKDLESFWKSLEFFWKSSSSPNEAFNKIEQKNVSIFKSFRSLWGLFLEACISSKEDIVCVIDGLDECVENDARDLIRAICEQYRNPSTSKLKILITSRPYAYIQNAFGSLTKAIHLSGDDESRSAMISKDIDLFIEHKLCEVKQDLTTRDLDTLRSTLTKSPQRTYLWVYLAFSHLQDMLGVFDIKDLDEQLPRTLDEAYEKIFQKSTDEIAGKRILQTLLAAYRPLLLSDIAILLTINENHSSEISLSIDSDEQWSRKIRSICGLFVVVVDSRVYLLHQTARRFLLHTKLADRNMSTWKTSLNLQDGHTLIADSCIQFLKLDHKDCNSTWQWDGFGELTFRTYCYTYWARHCQESNDASVMVSAQELCWQLRGTSKCQCRTRYFELLAENNYFNRALPLSLPARLGLPGVIELEILESNANRYEISRAMRLAVKSNHTDTVKTLLQHGAVIGNYLVYSSWPKWLTRRAWFADFFLGHSTLLHEAIVLKNTQLIKLLLRYGADVNAGDEWEKTPLHVLVEKVAEPSYDNKRPVGVKNMEILLAHGADLSLRDSRGWTAAAAFVMSSSSKEEDRYTVETVFHCLLPQEKNIDKFWPYELGFKTGDNHAPIFSSNEWSMTMLGGSAIAQNLHCIDLLLKIGANPKICDNRGNGLLHCTVLGGNVSTVKHVLALDSSVHATNIHGHTALTLAAIEGSSIISELLLHTGADISHIDKAGMTMLMHAVTNPNHDKAMVDLCLEAGLPLNAVDKRGMTALMHAAECCCWSGVEQLLNAGADASIGSLEGHTLLCKVESQGHAIDIKHLLPRLQNSNQRKCCNSWIGRLASLRIWLQHFPRRKITSIMTATTNVCDFARYILRLRTSQRILVSFGFWWLGFVFPLSMILTFVVLPVLAVPVIFLHRITQPLALLRDPVLWFLKFMCGAFMYIPGLLLIWTMRPVARMIFEFAYHQDID